MPTIELNAILGQQVIATIDGVQVKIKEGESTAEGLKLIAVTRKSATFEYEGESITVEPSSRIGTQFTQVSRKSISINRDPSGHYFIKGEINGRTVNFLVDTGATDISLTRNQAAAIDLQWQKGETAVYATANGNLTAYRVTLDRVTVGGITVNLVDASVSPLSNNGPALLGMSFLKHFDMKESDNILTLTRKY